MSEAIEVERQVTAERLNELGVHGWPTWKDGLGKRQLVYYAGEKSFLLDGVQPRSACRMAS